MYMDHSLSAVHVCNRVPFLPHLYLLQNISHRYIIIVDHTSCIVKMFHLQTIIKIKQFILYLSAGLNSTLQLFREKKTFKSLYLQR